jgi:hypothetical protein
MTPKNKLHALIDQCDDDLLVDHAIALFSKEEEDWWGKLSDAEKQKTILAIKELDTGNGVPHEAIMQEAWKRIGK